MNHVRRWRGLDALLMLFGSSFWSTKPPLPSSFKPVIPRIAKNAGAHRRVVADAMKALYGCHIVNLQPENAAVTPALFQS